MTGDWLGELDAQVDWPNGQSFALQVDGNDLIHINDIDSETGDATVLVFASTDPEAPVVWRGTANVRRHLDYRGPRREIGERDEAGGNLCREMRPETPRG